MSYDWILACPCGRGDYDVCTACPYTSCSVHGTPEGIAVDELTRLGEELGLYDSGPEVCVTHKRFVPCRASWGECCYSSDADDVASVREWQQHIGLFFHVCLRLFPPIRRSVPGWPTQPGTLLNCPGNSKISSP